MRTNEKQFIQCHFLFLFLKHKFLRSGGGNSFRIANKSYQSESVLNEIRIRIFIDARMAIPFHDHDWTFDGSSVILDLFYVIEKILLKHKTEKKETMTNKIKYLQLWVKNKKCHLSRAYVRKPEGKKASKLGISYSSFSHFLIANFELEKAIPSGQRKTEWRFFSSIFIFVADYPIIHHPSDGQWSVFVLS